MAQHILYWLEGGQPKQLEFDNDWFIAAWILQNMKDMLIKPDCRFYCRDKDYHLWLESLPYDMATQTKWSKYTVVKNLNWIPKPIRMLVMIGA